MQAFAAYTSGSAHVNHLDDTGVLAPGLLADLAVLDRDPFAGDPAAIGETRVVATYVDGRCSVDVWWLPSRACRRLALRRPATRIAEIAPTEPRVQDDLVGFHRQDVPISLRPE